MKIEIAALRAVAAQHQVPPASVTDAVVEALNTAYAGALESGSATTAGTIELHDDGTVVLRTPDGGTTTPDGFGRIAVATVRQAVVSWVRDQERRAIVGPWAGKEGKPVVGRVLGDGRNGELRLRIDGVNAVLPAGEQIDSETLPVGTDVTVLLLAANADKNQNIKLTVSRRQPTLATTLLTKDHPAFRAKRVEVVDVAREPGVRTKISLTPGENAPADLDVVAETTGAGGFRIWPVTEALGGETIDLVVHDPDPATYAANALTPATGVTGSYADETRRNVIARVPVDQVPAATGTGGLNMRLAQRLTGTKIQIVPTD